MFIHNDAIVGEIRTAPIGTPWDDVFVYDEVDVMDAPADYSADSFAFDPYVA